MRTAGKIAGAALVIGALVAAFALWPRPIPLPPELEHVGRVTTLVSEQQVQTGTGYSVIRVYSVQVSADSLLDVFDADARAVHYPWVKGPLVRLVGPPPDVLANVHASRGRMTGQTLWAARVEVDRGQKLSPEDARGWTCFVDLSRRLQTPWEALQDTVRGWFGPIRSRDDPEVPLLFVSDPDAQLGKALSMRRETIPLRR